MNTFFSRLLANCGVLLGVSVLSFLLIYVVPGDPVRVLVGPKADETTVANIRRELGLDRPLVVQYGRYLANLAQGELGRSFVTNEDILDSILERLPATASLALVSLLLAVVLGVGFGLLAASYTGTKVDHLLFVGSLIAVSLPTFWVGMLLLYVFAFRLRLLPLGGLGLWNLILPALTLALGMMGYYVRVVAAQVRQILAQDFIRTARAKGVSSFRIFTVHALRNALLPLTTLLGLDLAGLMGGVVLTETVFNWPGLGRLAVDAVFNQDIPMIMGTVLFSAVLVVVANTVADVVYALVDPRVGRASS